MVDDEECVGAMPVKFLHVSAGDSHVSDRCLDGQAVVSTKRLLLFWTSDGDSAAVEYNAHFWKEMSHAELGPGRQSLDLWFDDTQYTLFSGDTHLTWEFVHLLAMRPAASLCPFSWASKNALELLCNEVPELTPPASAIPICVLSDLQKPGLLEPDREYEAATGIQLLCSVQVDNKSDMYVVVKVGDTLHLCLRRLADFQLVESQGVSSVKELLFDPEEPQRLSVVFWAEDTLSDVTAPAELPDDRWHLAFLSAAEARRFAVVINDDWKPLFQTDLPWRCSV
eukprot:m.287774 g.287774  ORF g.287774 m.287774 type:complete len:282 (-) comp19447_c0_seq5:58-903(-)